MNVNVGVDIAENPNKASVDSNMPPTIPPNMLPTTARIATIIKQITAVIKLISHHLLFIVKTAASTAAIKPIIASHHSNMPTKANITNIHTVRITPAICPPNVNPI